VVVKDYQLVIFQILKMHLKAIIGCGGYFQQERNISYI
jgi:hypothetical protein